MRCLFWVSAVLLVLACNSPALREPLGPKQDETCGVSEIQCYEERPGNVLTSTGTCCARDAVCGGAFPNVGCPAGWCCMVSWDSGPSDTLEAGRIGSSRLAHVTVTAPQRHIGQ